MCAIATVWRCISTSHQKSVKSFDCFLFIFRPPHRCLLPGDKCPLALSAVFPQRQVPKGNPISESLYFSIILSIFFYFLRSFPVYEVPAHSLFYSIFTAAYQSVIEAVCWSASVKYVNFRVPFLFNSDNAFGRGFCAKPAPPGGRTVPWQAISTPLNLYAGRSGREANFAFSKAAFCPESRPMRKFSLTLLLLCVKLQRSKAEKI